MVSGDAVAGRPGAERLAGSGRTVNLGNGRVVPYPEPSTPAASKVGAGNRRTGTKPELLLRSALHRRGMRFRKDHLLRLGQVRMRPDVVFTRRRVAVFVDGCFWHSCPEHQHVPRSNLDYWLPKFASNAERDRRVDAALEIEGWTVLRIWEHVSVEDAVRIVEAAIDERSPVDARARTSGGRGEPAG